MEAVLGYERESMVQCKICSSHRVAEMILWYFMLKDFIH